MARDRTDLIRDAASLPFEAAIKVLADVMILVWRARLSSTAQIEVARRLLGSANPLFQRMADLVAANPKLLLFTEQQVAAAMRLVIDHAGEHWRRGLNRREYDTLLTLLIYSSDLCDFDLGEARQPTEDEVLSHLTRVTTYNHVSDIVSSVARASRILTSFPLRTKRASWDWEAWAHRHFRVSLDDQFVTAFGLAALSDALSVGGRPRTIFDLRDLDSSVISANPAKAFSLISDTRKGFQRQFKRHGYSWRAVAWNNYPFLLRPFLRLEGSRYLLLSPRGLTSAAGEGLFHRALLSSEMEGYSHEAGRERLGKAIEAYARALAFECCTRATAVDGERKYGPAKASAETPDIMIQEGNSLIAVEIRSGSFGREFVISGELADFQHEFEELVLKKARQLARRLSDIYEGARPAGATINYDQIETYRPVLVVPFFHLSPLAQKRVEAEFKSACRIPRKVLKPVVMDMEEFEILMGLCQKSNVTLKSLLHNRKIDGYSAHPVQHWLDSAFGSLPVDDRLPTSLVTEFLSKRP